MTARYDKQNAESLAPLEEAGVTIRPYPDDIMNAAREAAFALYDELAAADENFATRASSRGTPSVQRIARWFGLAEASIVNFALPPPALAWERRRPPEADGARRCA